MNTALQKKMKESIEIVQKAEKTALTYDPENGFYLAFSGGKDSLCVHRILEIANVKFKGHFNLTSMEPPELIRFVRENYPNIENIKPRKSVYELSKTNSVPTRLFRWCCRAYKETAGAGKVTVTGVRKAESTNRGKRKIIEVTKHKFAGSWEEFTDFQKNNATFSINNAGETEMTIGCIHGKETIILNPIIEWTENDVWTFIKEQNLKYCKLYDEGYKRIGCMLCPMQSRREAIRDIEKYPHLKKRWIKAIQYLIDNNKLHRMTDRMNIPEEEKAEMFFNYWISKKSFEKFFIDNFVQKKLF